MDPSSRDATSGRPPSFKKDAVSKVQLERTPIYPGAGVSDILEPARFAGRESTFALGGLFRIHLFAPGGLIGQTTSKG
jgi:hypothetical protein